MNAACKKRFGPFEILEKLGSGGMGVVFKARFAPQEPVQHRAGMANLKVNDIVALKIANWLVVNEPVLGQRFENEYKVTRLLRHPNLVRALGFGWESQMPFLILEYVPGQSLDKRLKERGPLPLEAALRLFTGIIHAVEFIHQNNLVHRDIKPGNILIDDNHEGEAKLADLGLLKDMEAESFLTNSRVGLGTLGFAAPEQFDDAKHADHRCDIYGLAATLFFALTGRFPFGMGSPMQVMKRKLENLFVPLSEFLPGLGPTLDQTVIRALHPDPAVRPASATDFLTGIVGASPPQGHAIAQPLVDAAPASPNRRGHVRFPVGLAATVKDLISATRTHLPAHILDVSTSGMSLRGCQHFEPDTLLHVHVPSEYTGIPAIFLVRTRWARKLADPEWLFGCTFLRPLEDEDLDRFLFTDLAKTGVIG